MEEKKMTIYERAKEIGRKYIAPAIVATGLYFSNGNAYPAELPVNDSVKTSLVREQENKLEQAVVKFNEAIKDRRFTVKEQKEVNNLFISSGVYNGVITPNEDVKELSDKINLNLNGEDYGTPELEYSLREQGLEVKVESHFSEGDTLFPLVLGGLGSILAGGALWLFRPD